MQNRGYLTWLVLKKCLIIVTFAEKLQSGDSNKNIVETGNDELVSLVM